MDLQSLLFASRGSGPQHGLVRWRRDSLQPVTLATVKDLSALAWHPTFPVVYGTAGVGEPGRLVAIGLDGDEGTILDDVPSGSDEMEPCHVAVDPGGHVVAVTNYTSGVVALWRLDDTGRLGSNGSFLQLHGSGPEIERQDRAHPHQAVFREHDGELKLLVVDLGADRVREFVIDLATPVPCAVEVRQWEVPSGAGPRHLVILDDGRFAVSGELGSNLIIVDPISRATTDVPSTVRTGPARTRHSRNYPGDIQRSQDSRYVFFANRGHDTISMFDVGGERPVLVSEQDSGVKWPQHILVWNECILVAGWDSSAVTTLSTVGDRLGEARELCSIPSPGWILPDRVDT